MAEDEASTSRNTRPKKRRRCSRSENEPQQQYKPVLSALVPPQSGEIYEGARDLYHKQQQQQQRQHHHYQHEENSKSGIGSSSSSSSINKSSKSNKKLFEYGNYEGYYGYRNATNQIDPRLALLQPAWFAGADILDMGCNSGFLTIGIARRGEGAAPRRITGVDLDSGLVAKARRNVQWYIDLQDSIEVPASVAVSAGAPALGITFPISMPMCLGPLVPRGAPGHSAITPSIDIEKAKENRTPETNVFPYNIEFFSGNLLADEGQWQNRRYDLIMCLSLTKWVHLNWGDDGVRTLFKKAYNLLRPGGRFVLEPQPWESYRKKRKLTTTIRSNYESISFRPDAFCDYLLGADVGFESVVSINELQSSAEKKTRAYNTVASSRKKNTGFDRSIYVFKKGEDSKDE